MAKNNNLTDFLTSLANKFRTKLGITSAINPQDFENKIDDVYAAGVSSVKIATGTIAFTEKTAQLQVSNLSFTPSKFFVCNTDARLYLDAASSVVGFVGVDTTQSYKMIGQFRTSVNQLTAMWTMITDYFTINEDGILIDFTGLNYLFTNGGTYSWLACE